MQRLAYALGLTTLTFVAACATGGRVPGDASRGGTDAATADAGPAVDCTTDAQCAMLDAPCQQGVCGVTGVCEQTALADGTSCDDEDPCTTGDACTAGACAGEATDCSALTDMCVMGACNPTSGACEAQPIAEGGSCDDGDMCTTGETCMGGTCGGGTAADCSALMDDCNNARCDPVMGCVAQPTNAGMPCDDGDVCTEATTCDAGACTGSPVDCSALSAPCRTGICSSAGGGCVAMPAADGSVCDDGDGCTTVDRCTAGSCIGSSPRSCAALDDMCNAGACLPATGMCARVPRPDGTSCNDGNSCTSPDRCTAGVCGGPDTCCGIQDFRLNEVFGFSPDYIELVNRSTCTLSTSGLSLLFRLDCDTVNLTFDFPAISVPAGGVARVIDSSATMANEVYFGANICHNVAGEGWVALCQGPCNASCTNYLDYMEISGATPPMSPPTCASFTPAPLSMTGAATTDSATRLSFLGSGRTGRQSDWARRASTR